MVSELDQLRGLPNGTTRADRFFGEQERKQEVQQLLNSDLLAAMASQGYVFRQIHPDVQLLVTDPTKTPSNMPVEAVLAWNFWQIDRGSGVMEYMWREIRMSLLRGRNGKSLGLRIKDGLAPDQSEIGRVDSYRGIPLTSSTRSRRSLERRVNKSLKHGVSESALGELGSHPIKFEHRIAIPLSLER